MTTSKYNKTMNFNNGTIVMNEGDWPIFVKSILTGCTWTGGSITHKSRKWQMCEFDARYYEDAEGTRHFHVTNDTRRKIRRFIAQTYSL